MDKNFIIKNQIKKNLQKTGKKWPKIRKKLLGYHEKLVKNTTNVGGKWRKLIENCKIMLKKN